MTYTAQSCREEAAINDKFGDPIMNDPDLLRAHADALEELATLRKQLAERDAEIAALKGHADLMAYGKGTAAINAMVAYRAAYPKE